VEVTGYPGLPTQEAITGVVFHTAVMKIGEFACSNELLNQIQKNITWGLRGNLHSIPTDCPQRDERLGWAGDAQAIGPTICRNFGMARFFSKWITDLADTQNADEGWVTDVAPTLGGSAAAPGWGDALVIVPWTVYQEYGDRRILEENYEAMSKWVGYMKKKSQNGLYNPEHIYGDWVASVESPKPPMASAYYYYSTSLMARIATLLNRPADANRFRAWMLVTRQAFNQAYFDEAKRDYEGGTQAAKVLPLHFGLVNEDFAPGVAANLIRDIQERGYHLSTGFPGSAVMMPELTKWADTETLWKLAVQDTYPSWGYMVRKGATTIWELWNSDTAGPGMNSRNHYAFGAVGQWYFQTLAGIDSDETAPGYKRVHFRPTPMGGLEWAKASITTLYGLVSSEWHLDKEGFRLAITVPPNTTGLLEIPTFGSNKPTILEGKETILSLGKPSRSKGIRYQGLNNGRAAFELEAGRYEFRVGK
jgi:alpha-L-rhamnosidase